MEPDIPTTMQAVQLDDPGQPVVVRRIAVPRPGPGQVLVRVAAAPINPTDLGLLRGSRAAGRGMPLVPGSEGSGTVAAAGAGLLPRLLLNRRVAVASAPGSDGTWADYVLTRASYCMPLSRHLSFEQGAMLVVNPLTALAFFDMAGRDRHAALVSTAAAGALGRMVLRLGQRQNVPVIHVVRRAAQAAVLRSLGAEHVLVSDRPDFAETLRQRAADLHATLLLDAVAGEMTGVLLEAAPAGSTVVVYGSLSRQPTTLEPRTLLFGDKRVAGFYLPNWLRRRSLLQTIWLSQRVQRLASSVLQTTVRQRRPLPDVQAALDGYVSDMTAGKIILVPGGESGA
jgi:NADPH:quinone reductase